MTVNRLKLGRTVSFMKYLASVVSLIFLVKTLIWNKINFPTSNLLNLSDMVKNEFMKSLFLLKNLPKSLFLFDLSLLNLKISRASN